LSMQGIECEDAPDFWRTEAEGYDPDVVVVVLGAWDVLDREDPELGRLEVGTERWRSWALEGLERLVAELATGVPTAQITIAEVPCYDEPDRGLGGASSERNDPARVEAVNDVINELIRLHPARLSLLPLDEWLCDDGEAIESRDDVHLRSDGVHFTHEGAMLTWEQWWIPRLRSLVPNP
jgi:lysophospholipase L1-like esterase